MLKLLLPVCLLARLVLSSVNPLVAREIPSAAPTEQVLNAPTSEPTATSGPTITIKTGTFIGKRVGKTDIFRGIPFAEPPVGGRRLRPPQYLTRYLGSAVNAQKQAAMCSQFTGDLVAQLTQLDSARAMVNTPEFVSLMLAAAGQVQSEDCLTLDVYRPQDTAPDAKLPVLFWIFGGGFELGSTSASDGQKMVEASINSKQPMIFVAVNYRVNGFGFLGGKEILADGAANLGLLDQRVGLQWVADNIGSIGGDPSRVTLWGESAGSISVFDQLALYGGNNTWKGRPLFRAAIMNSGTMAPAEPVDGPRAQAIYNTVVMQAGCGGRSDSLACLREVPFNVLQRAIASVPAITSYNSVALSYLPRPDGVVIPDNLSVIAKKGQYALVPMIVGDQEDEGTPFALLQNNVTNSERLARYLQTIFFKDATMDDMRALVATYPADATAGSPFNTGIFNEIYPGFKRLAAILGDLVFTLSRRLFLEYHVANYPNAPVWSYLGSYFRGTPVLGTFHYTDILAMQNGVAPIWSINTMRGYYINFVNTMDPNIAASGKRAQATQLISSSSAGVELQPWPIWTAKKQMMQFFATYGAILIDNFRENSANWMRLNIDKLNV